ncbi:MAG TPA: tetratricopeptide repeat protein [Trueperaceae bacterium]|nr:tetratricopeptide repeat protein [Trueperaceae bacterium]
MLREITGADYLISGSVDYMANDIVAHIILSGKDASYTFDFTTDSNDPAALVDSAVSVLSTRMGLPTIVANAEIDLSSGYGDYIDALTLAAYGEIEAAISRLDAMQKTAKADELLAALEAVRVGLDYDNNALMAVLSLALEPVDENISLGYFDKFAAETSLPVVKLWQAALSDSKGDSAKAKEYYNSIDFYPFGVALRAAFNRVQGLDYISDEKVVLAQNDTAALLAVASAANFAEDTATEKQALRRLTEILPDYVYPFERLSFIAFDEDDAISAAQALAVAVRLEPESDLYWTNLGWSYYLLGILDKSETASLHAIELNPDAHIALFNLGLARTVTGRLEDAIKAYNKAIALDPEVDDEAVHDLENALELYPSQAGIHYSLAYLYEEELRRDEAAQQYQLFLDALPTSSVSYSDTLIADAQSRLEALLAPPAPFFIADSVTIGLGLAGIEAAPYHAGELIYPSFELFTDGDELPRNVTYDIVIKDSENVLTGSVVDYSIPENAIGYVIDDNSILLPSDAWAGKYELRITISTDDGRKAVSVSNFEIAEGRSFLRQLISRDIFMYDIDDKPFYSAKDLNKSNEVLEALLLTEVHNLAGLAEDKIPPVESGRFAGMTGGEMFSAATTADISDFLQYLLSTDANQSEFLFVDSFLQWALEVAQ